MNRNLLTVFLVGTTFIVYGYSSHARMQDLVYPKARKVEQVDTYGNVAVADPYRWLEDDRSPETARWVAAENKLTEQYLANIPYRQELKRRLEHFYDYTRYTAPTRRGTWFFFSKNNGLQNQDVLYVQEGLTGPPRILLDPNTLSADGTSRLLVVSPSKAGKYLAYTISKGGSDWQEAHVLEVASGRVLGDTLNWIKGSGLAWAGDGFFYSRYPVPEAEHELSSKNEFHTVYYHRIGLPQSNDELIYEDKAHPLRFHNVSTTEDERFAILDIRERGKGLDGNALFYREVARPGKGFIPIVPEIRNDRYWVINNIGAKFLIGTNNQASHNRAVLYNPAGSGSQWKDVLPEKAEPLLSVDTAGGKLLATYMQDVATSAYVYSLNGRLENQIRLPGLGVATGFEGNHDDKFIFYSFSALNVPDTIFKYDFESKTSSVFHSPEIHGFRPESYETQRVFFKSKDGTRIPMFLVYRKGLKLDGANPVLLSSYGGFNIVNAPSFFPLRIALLEQGFVYASANIRGGGEYGEQWHPSEVNPWRETAS